MRPSFDRVILLVRHCHAGAKGRNADKDRLRPLTKLGLAEADALAQVLLPYAPQRILSSPLARCLQTVAPTARALDLEVEQSEQLGPLAGKSAVTLIRKISSVEQGGVMLRTLICTHGEVISEIQGQYKGSASAGFGPDSPREKSSVWVLETSNRRIISATYLPPPRLG